MTGKLQLQQRQAQKRRVEREERDRLEAAHLKAVSALRQELRGLQASCRTLEVQLAAQEHRTAEATARAEVSFFFISFVLKSGVASTHGNAFFVKLCASRKFDAFQIGIYGRDTRLLCEYLCASLVHTAAALGAAAGGRSQSTRILRRARCPCQGSEGNGWYLKQPFETAPHHL